MTHYHWNSDMTGLRACSLDDELSEPTFYVPSPQADQTGPAALPDGWTDAGYTADDEDDDREAAS